MIKRNLENEAGEFMGKNKLPGDIFNSVSGLYQALDVPPVL